MSDFNLQQFYQDKFYEPALVSKIGQDDSVLNLIRDLRPNGNVFRQIHQLLEQLSAIEKCEISSLLSQADGILENSKLNRKEKISKLKKFLEKKRYPMRFEIEDKLEIEIKEIYKKYAVSVSVPKELEGDTLDLNFKIKGTRDLSKKQVKLKELFSSEEIKNIFSILEGE